MFFILKLNVVYVYQMFVFGFIKQYKELLDPELLEYDNRGISDYAGFSNDDLLFDRIMCLTNYGPINYNNFMKEIREFNIKQKILMQMCIEYSIDSKEKFNKCQKIYEYRVGRTLLLDQDYQDYQDFEDFKVFLKRENAVYYVVFGVKMGPRDIVKSIELLNEAYNSKKEQLMSIHLIDRII